MPVILRPARKGRSALIALAAAYKWRADVYSKGMVYALQPLPDQTQERASISTSASKLRRTRYSTRLLTNGIEL
jgi:hypothetical protein